MSSIGAFRCYSRATLREFVPGGMFQTPMLKMPSWKSGVEQKLRMLEGAIQKLSERPVGVLEGPPSAISVSAIPNQTPVDAGGFKVQMWVSSNTSQDGRWSWISTEDPV